MYKSGAKLFRAAFFEKNLKNFKKTIDK